MERINGAGSPAESRKQAVQMQSENPIVLQPCVREEVNRTCEGF